MANVRMPDGVVVQFPDDMPPDAIRQMILSKFPDAGGSPSAVEKPALPSEFGNLPVPGYAGTEDPKPEKGYEPSSVPILDRVNSFANSAVDAIPIVGPALTSIGNNVDAAFASMVEGKPVTAEERARINQTEREQYPVESMAGTVTGAVAPLVAAGGVPALAKGLGMTGTVGQRMLAGAASGAGIAGADALARGATPDEALSAGAVGLGVGGAFPIAAKAASAVGKGVQSAAQAVMPGVDNAASSAIKGIASGLFNQSKASGVAVRPEAYGQFIDDLAAGISNGLDQTLHPDTSAALANLLGRKGAPMSFTDLHIIRQIAQDASMSQKPADARLAGQIVDRIDDFIGGLTPQSIVGAQDPRAAAQALHEGINLWSKAAKTGTIEEAIYRAQNVASGFENGIRVELRKILQNPQTRRLYNDDELGMIEAVVRGTPGANMMRLLGKFGFGDGVAGNAMGGFMGGMGGAALGGSPMAGIVASLGATGARKLSENMTGSAANKVVDLVANGPRAQQPAMQTALARLMAANQAPVDLPMAPSSLAVLMNR